MTKNSNQAGGGGGGGGSCLNSFVKPAYICLPTTKCLKVDLSGFVWVKDFERLPQTLTTMDVKTTEFLLLLRVEITVNGSKQLSAETMKRSDGNEPKNNEPKAIAS